MTSSHDRSHRRRAIALTLCALPLLATAALAAKPIVGSWDIEGIQIFETIVAGQTNYDGGEFTDSFTFNEDKTFASKGLSGKWKKDGKTHTADFKKSFKAAIKAKGATNVKVAVGAFSKIEVVPETSIQGKLKLRATYKALGVKIKSKADGVFTGVPIA